jgi:hypothetical protein
VTAETFEPLQGDSFEVALEESSQTVTGLVLRSVLRSRWNRPSGEPGFVLTFEGPAVPPLPQRLYWLKHAKTGELSIFLVPISGDAQKREYEAVFN